MKRFVIILLIFGVVGLVFWMVYSHQKVVVHQSIPKDAPTIPRSTHERAKIVNGKLILPPQTKFSGCVMQGALPDPECTPGAIDETRTLESICDDPTSKFRKNFSSSFKKIIFGQYNEPRDAKGIKGHEADHLIAIELGGSNNSANVWPERANPFPGYHEKDHVENYLHAQVCVEKTMTLAQAQYKIATNWIAVWEEMKKNHAKRYR